MTYKSVNPFNAKTLAVFDELSDASVDGVIEAAHSAYRDNWRTRSTEARASLLRQVAVVLRARIDELSRFATLEMGKLLGDARAEVQLCAEIFEYYADHAAPFLADKSIEVDTGTATVTTESIGVIFCIEPWNYPYYQLARVAAPNLAAGNAVIAKHAPNVPQCALAFEKALRDAGVPEGVYSNVFISNDQAAKLIADVRIRGVALTGSERAGAAVAAEAGKALKKSTMELGGSDAFIVLDDADIELAANVGAASRLRNNGQVCNAAKRFIVDARVYDAFVSRFVAKMAAVDAGDPLLATTTLGPLNSEAALALTLGQIDTAVGAGANVLLGGKRIDRPGFFIEPTVLADVSADNPVYWQEFFAPVAMVFRVNGETEAVKLANDSPFGLGASVISKDIARANRVARQLEAGMVTINQAGVSSPEVPFGGVKNSGYGRELSDLGINEFVNKKLIRS